MNYIDWTIVIILAATAIFLFIKNPAFRQKVIDEIVAHEAEVVNAAYNRLPQEVKDRVNSKDFADIISLGLESGKQILEEKLNKK